MYVAKVDPRVSLKCCWLPHTRSCELDVLMNPPLPGLLAYEYVLSAIGYESMTRLQYSTEKLTCIILD